MSIYSVQFVMTNLYISQGCRLHMGVCINELYLNSGIWIICDNLHGLFITFETAIYFEWDV